MFKIRPYREEDAVSIGRLIADTYKKYNLSSISTDDVDLYLGPFAYAYSKEPQHQHAIADIISADIVYIAEIDSDVVGILRGRPGKLQSLFVKGDYHRQGIGRKLVQVFEQKCREKQSSEIKVQATLYAVPFYTVMGYKRTTGVRRMRSFDGDNLPYQPMKKIL